MLSAAHSGSLDKESELEVARDAFYANFYDDIATPHELLRILGNLTGGKFEIMRHPDYTDPERSICPNNALRWESELLILTDPAIKESIDQRGIGLISFADRLIGAIS
jgi:predicted glycoside hydrolase/deacetylase ChbG (UPF0249 family)